MRLSRSASGELSRSERGRARRQRAMTQPTEAMVSHCAPVRMTPSESERYTCSAAKFSQTLESASTAPSKRSAWAASAAALMAPAEVPQITPKGLRSRARGPSASRRMRAISRSTPTW